MRWVADTGPLLHLAEAGALHLLPRLGEIALPVAVQTELSKLGPTLQFPEPLQVVSLSAPAKAGHYLDRLAASSLWVSPRIMAEAHAALRELAKPQA